MWSLLLACSSSPDPVVPPEASGSRPDIVLVSVDTLRADRLSAWGYETPTSPVLSGLVERSLRFSSAVAPAPWTLPSMTSLYTGLAPAEHGVVAPDLALASTHQTLAEALSDRGYRTAFFGVNPVFVDGHGLQQGFDEWHAWPGLSGRQLDAEIQRWLASQRDGAPLFLAVHYLEPHCRYRPPRDVADRFLDPTAPVQPLAEERYRAMGDCFRLQQADGAPELNLSVYRARYDAEVFEADRLIGDLLPMVADRDPWVAVVADHGESFWEHDDFGHGRQLFQEQVHVPLLLHRPGGVHEDRDAATSTTWLYGALLAAADGHPLPTPPALAWSETDYEGHRLRSVQSGDAKVIVDLVTGVAQGFDLDADPGERSPLAPDPALLAALRQRAGAPAAQAEPTAVPQQTQQQLRALGYTAPDQCPGSVGTADPVH